MPLPDNKSGTLSFSNKLSITTQSTSPKMSATQEPAIDLFAAFTSDRLLEIRRGKMKPLQGLTVLSGIDKTVCEDAVRIASGGIEGDEHDYTFHGGREKAIHGCE